MRILYINYGPQSGVTRSVLARLHGAGHEVEAFDPLEGFLYTRRLGRWQVPNLAPESVLATALAMARFRRHWKGCYAHTCWSFDRLSARCDHAIEASRPDVVLQAGVLFAPGRPGRTPYFLYCDHTRALNERYPKLPGLEPPIPFEQAWRRRETAVYHGAEAVFAMSEHVRRSLSEEYGLRPERVVVVGAGPNVEPTPSAVPHVRSKAFLFVGSQFVAKGGPEVLQAFASLRARHPGTELWMVGGEQPEHAGPRVKLLGLVSQAEVARYYAAASAFVLPTLREAFGLSFLEAMSFGLPCIGSDIEAIPEIIVDGETGFLVPPGHPDALAAAMERLLCEPTRAGAMGEAGRARVLERFGWDRAVRLMLGVMERGVAPAQGSR